MGLARKYPWGISVGEIFSWCLFDFLVLCFNLLTTLVESEEHCDYPTLKIALLSSHLEVVKDITHVVHYENYRQESLTKGVDSAKIEQELNDLEKQELKEKEKEKADRERRIALVKPLFHLLP